MRGFICIPQAEKGRVTHVPAGPTLSPPSANAFCISTSHEKTLSTCTNRASGVWKTSRKGFLTAWQITCHETQRESRHPGNNIPCYNSDVEGMSCYSQVTSIILKTSVEKYFFLCNRTPHAAYSLNPQKTYLIQLSGTTKLSSAGLKNRKDLLTKPFDSIEFT